MKLHLPSLQAAAAVASATAKDKPDSLRLVHVRACGDGGQLVESVCNGHAAIQCHHPCQRYHQGPGTVPEEGTEIPPGRRLLLWGPLIPTRKILKSEIRAGSWIELDALISAGVESWWIDQGDREIKSGHGGEPLKGIPDLGQIFPEIDPDLLLAGSARRVNADYLELMCKASRILVRGSDESGIDRVSIEIFETSRIEAMAKVLIDLLPHYQDNPVEAKAWALVMPIQRRAGPRGIVA